MSTSSSYNYFGTFLDTVEKKIGGIDDVLNAILAAIDGGNTPVSSLLSIVNGSTTALAAALNQLERLGLIARDERTGLLELTRDGQEALFRIKNLVSH